MKYTIDNPYAKKNIERVDTVEYFMKDGSYVIKRARKQAEEAFWEGSRAMSKFIWSTINNTQDGR